MSHKAGVGVTFSCMVQEVSVLPSHLSLHLGLCFHNVQALNHKSFTTIQKVPLNAKGVLSPTSLLRDWSVLLASWGRTRVLMHTFHTHATITNTTPEFYHKAMELKGRHWKNHTLGRRKFLCYASYVGLPYYRLGAAFWWARPHHPTIIMDHRG